MTTRRVEVVLLAALVGVGCAKKNVEPPARTVAARAAEPMLPTYGRLPRLEFNARAQERFTPLFWRTDANGNRVLDPDELAVLVGPQGLKRDDFIDASGAFTKLFKETYDALVKPLDLSALDATERARREAVVLELSQGRATLVENDFSAGSAQDKAILQHLTRAATLLEGIHAKQHGTAALQQQLRPDDVASQALFHRNQGPWCAAPKTENDPNCNALNSKPKRLSGLYPDDVQADPKFCEALAKEKNAKALMDHFSVVQRAKTGFVAVPYHQAYADESKAIAKELTDAAAAITSDDEKAFKAYLLAAAKGFTTNDWEPANAAWVAMGPGNSKWYLRIAPDEVYSEPCAWKAQYALQLARINLDSLAWQKKLEPVKGDMEKTLAALAGPPYKARDVKFKLPDFIDVVLNAGDQRNPHGATIGQSLPNWGKVAEKGGRTVAMTNLYTDADSQETLKSQMASLFCSATMAKASTEAGIGVMSTVLHEAAHNLGPAHEYKVKGKVDDEVFGGPLASMMEELKAQTSALYFSEWLAEKNVISLDEAQRAHVRDVAWAFGHISRGMYDGGGKPKTYSQLASIQLGTLHKAGVLTWKKDERAGNGTDTGCFELDLGTWKATVDALAARVLKAKGSGDKAEAEAMKAAFVDAKDEWSALRDTITERWLRAPKATFVYSIKQ